jgi:hypothetical protein
MTHPEVTKAHREAAARVLDYYTDQSLTDRVALAVAYAESRGYEAGKRAGYERGRREGAEAAWAVKVLDAWASRDEERYVSFGPQYGGPSPGNLGGHYCSLRRNDHRDAELREGYFGTTPDAARIAAARALAAADPSLPQPAEVENG